MHPMYVRPEGRGIESVRIFYPSITLYIYNVCSLLVLLLLFYVNLFKERFFLRVSGNVFPKADAKVLLFHEPTKCF